MAQGGERRTAGVRSGDRIRDCRTCAIVGSAPPHTHATDAAAQHAQGDDTTAPPAHTHGVAATTRHRTTQPPAHPAAVTPPLSVGRWRQAGGGTGHRQVTGKARQGDQPDQPPGTYLPVPARPPGTPQLDRRVPCINMQSNGETAQLGHRFGFLVRDGAVTARSSPFPRENHLKPAGTGQERAKTQVSVHKGGVS